MYPAGDLSEIYARKALIRRRIAAHRAVCVDNAGVVVEPIERINRLHAQWKQIAPFLKMAAIPAGFLLTRKFKRSGSLLSTAMKWAPLAFKVVRSFRASQASSSAT